MTRPVVALCQLARGFPADLRLAARRLLATPLFTIFAVLSLAVGVGVTTAVFSVVDSIFLKGFGVRDPGQVVFPVTHRRPPDAGDRVRISLAPAPRR